MACFGSCRSGESLGVRTDEVLPFAAKSATLATVDLVRQTEQAGIEPTAGEGRLSNVDDFVCRL